MISRLAKFVLFMIIVGMIGFACGGGKISVVPTPVPTLEPTPAPGLTPSPTSAPRLAPTSMPTPHSSLEFAVDMLPVATIGNPYKYSFCNPEPMSGLFCGGPLSSNSVPTNPTGGTPNYTFSHGIGLPFGLTLNFNGVLTGAPAALTPTGNQRFEVCATDQVGKKVCHEVEILVNGANPTPTPTPVATPTPLPSPMATPTPTLTPVPLATPTPTPTPLPTMTATPRPTATPTPAPTATVQPGLVSIGAVGCAFISRVEYPNAVTEEFEVTISGSVTGPVGATFRLSWDLTDAAPFGFGEFTSSWTRIPYLSSARRESGDPETGTWSERFLVHITTDPGQQKNGTVGVTASVTTSATISETLQLVACQWQ